MSAFEIALSVALGVGLAAATGLRIFLPLLIVAVAGYTGHLSLGESLAFLATPAAIAMLGIAAIIEVAGYYIPGVDNILDAAATPAAFIAGTVVAAAAFADLPPLVQWGAAIIAGGGVAGVTQGATALLRANSTVFTGGLGNAVVATGELIGSVVLALLALAAPFVALLLAALFLWLVFRFTRRARRHEAGTGA
jgi:hypothetical protein